MVAPSGFVGECYNKWNVEVIEIKGNIDMNDCQWRENVRNNNYSGLLAACGSEASRSNQIRAVTEDLLAKFNQVG